MQNALLFLSTVLIWGTTCIAIAWQVGPVPALLSVFYRFGSAAVILLLGLAVLRRLRVPGWRDQPLILAHALCLFCCNFLYFYSAATFLPSGLISVIFSLATLLNIVNTRLFFADRISGRTPLAAALGESGVLLLFGHQVLVRFDAGTLKGTGLAALGTLFFSLGNMASRRNSAARIAPLGLIWLTGTPVVLPPDARYLAALAYLSIIGSVVGFITYLMLVSRIDSAHAAYATVLFPRRGAVAVHVVRGLLLGPRVVGRTGADAVGQSRYLLALLRYLIVQIIYLVDLA